MNVPIQTGKKTFVDSFGNTQDTSTATALGPLPEMPDESRTGRRFQPIRFWNDRSKAHDDDWRTAKEKPQNGYGNTGVDDLEWRRAHWDWPTT